jgi:hypothetical protein
VNAPAAPQVITDYWMAALKYRAIGRTAASLREQAADPVMTEGLALLSGITAGQERIQVLAVADAVDALAAEGLTPEQCYFLANLDKEFGPYPGAAPVTAGWQTHRQCSKCAPCPGNCGCDCHAPVNSAPEAVAA